MRLTLESRFDLHVVGDNAAILRALRSAGLDKAYEHFFANRVLLFEGDLDAGVVGSVPVNNMKELVDLLAALAPVTSTQLMLWGSANGKGAACDVSLGNDVQHPITVEIRIAEAAIQELESTED